MYRKLLSAIAALALAGGVASAQRIEPVDPNVQDIIRTLNANGYEFYSFDLSTFNDKTYEIEVYIQEGDSTGLLTDNEIRGAGWQSRRFLKDIPEEYRQKVTPIDPVTGLIDQISRIGISIAPETDSTGVARISFGKYGISQVLKQQPIIRYEKDQPILYRYGTRPFKIETFESGKDIPLVLYASYWYDSQVNLYRLCGEEEIDPDMSTPILKNIPHYYVIGIRLTEKPE